MAAENSVLVAGKKNRVHVSQSGMEIQRPQAKYGCVNRWYGKTVRNM
jgi:hypothetical protein